ncbi:PLP-dependent aminotransferase family protein [Taklimakanibacter deserti]|uniref:aminotransferase-like domain-containing protein n=1 Tax=Taklimakanibacter deserti TaxID=2267839 RepID=UPI0013C4CDB8
MNIRLANRMTRVQPSAIRELLRHGADPRIISFGGGYPDSSLFPLEQLEAVYHASIAGDGREALQYTVSNGPLKLREQIASRMRKDGVECGADNVLVLQGGQQGLDLVAKMLIDKDDVIVTENPTFLGALIAFNPCEPRYAVVKMDDDGMDMDDLERTLKENPAAKLLYTVPDFQNPTGVTLSRERRKRLVELANRFDFVILEDTPYRELRYQGETIPTIKSFDTEGRVIYLGSFSKILTPGMRLGWAVGSEDLIQRLGLLKLAADTQCSTLNMAAASLFLDKYDIDAHIATIRRTYRRKKELMLDTIRRTFPQDVAFTEPSGGMFTWLTFPENFDTTRFMADHALPEARVAYVPGATFFPLEQQVNHARLSYSTHTDEAIVQGITALGRLLTSRRGA